MEKEDLNFKTPLQEKKIDLAKSLLLTGTIVAGVYLLMVAHLPTLKLALIFASLYFISLIIVSFLAYHVAKYEDDYDEPIWS